MSGEREVCEVCEGCGEEIDPDCCGCGGERDDPEHGGYDYTHHFVPMGCDCFRICGRVTVEVGGKPSAAWLNEYVHGKPDRALAKLVATLAYERDLAATGEPQRATAFDCGMALRDAGEGESIAHLHWPSELSMTPFWDGVGDPQEPDVDWTKVIVFARDRGAYTL